jgi:hypothetical protein
MPSWSPDQQRDLPERQFRTVVHSRQLHPILQRQARASACPGLLATPTSDHPHELAELPRRQTRKHGHPLRLIRTDHLLHAMIIDQGSRSLREDRQMSRMGVSDSDLNQSTVIDVIQSAAPTLLAIWRSPR